MINSSYFCYMFYTKTTVGIKLFTAFVPNHMNHYFQNINQQFHIYFNFTRLPCVGRHESVNNHKYIHYQDHMMTLIRILSQCGAVYNSCSTSHDPLNPTIQFHIGLTTLPEQLLLLLLQVQYKQVNSRKHTCGLYHMLLCQWRQMDIRQLKQYLQSSND